MTRATVHTLRRARRGMTLIEIMVTIAIMLMVTAVMLPALSDAFMMQQRGAARKLALAFEQLHDEAILRNRTYRIAFNLDDHSWKVESGEPDVAVFDSDKARLLFEKHEKEALDALEPEQRATYMKAHASFSTPDDLQYADVIKLPENTHFKSIFTPQREEPVFPRGEGGAKKSRKDDPPDDEPLIVYSYVFANGSAEYTVVQLVDTEDASAGFTITVDPLSGRVDFHDELVDQKDLWRFLPDDGPRLD